MNSFLVIYLTLLYLIPGPPIPDMIALIDETHPYFATVMIDPGHGSMYNGRGVEDENNLAIGISLTKYLRSKGVRVLLTRNRSSHQEDLINIEYARRKLKSKWDNNSLDNLTRTLKANDYECQAIIRLHTDSHKFRRLDAYYPDKAGSFNGHTGPSPFVSMYSYHLAASITRSANRYLLSHGHKPGYINRESNLKRKKEIIATNGCFKCNLVAKSPVVWIEMTGHGDPKNSDFLRKNRRLYAKAIGDGIINFLQLYGSNMEEQKAEKSPGMDSFLQSWN